MDQKLHRWKVIEIDIPEHINVDNVLRAIEKKYDEEVFLKYIKKHHDEHPCTPSGGGLCPDDIEYSSEVSITYLNKLSDDKVLKFNISMELHGRR